MSRRRWCVAISFTVAWPVVAPLGCAGVGASSQGQVEAAQPSAASAADTPGGVSSDPSDSGGPVPPVACPADVGLCIDVEPRAAELFIDGGRLGPVAELGRGGPFFYRTGAGIYEVELKLRGYATWRAEVSVGVGLEHITVSLTPNP